MRVRLIRSGRERDELFNKADGLGRPIAKLEVRKRTGLVASTPARRMRRRRRRMRRRVKRHLPMNLN